MLRHFFLLFACHVCLVHGQQELDVLFYNVENLFDYEDDSLKADEEFLPAGDRHWNAYRYHEKLNHIGKAILACSGWNHPGLIGLCEIENRRCLDDLTHISPLKELNYQVLHRESNDRRGIDVALLYDKQLFKLQACYYYPHPSIASRNILHAIGLIGRKDTLHVFVNHWPSRYRGAVASDPLRKASALLLREKVDSIFDCNRLAKIVVMGDFNDYPTDKSLFEHLGAKKSGDLINLALLSDSHKGSYKHQGRWGYLDQFIVSNALLNSSSRWKVKGKQQYVQNHSFLLEEDEAYTGLKPKRSWLGFQYRNGFSDHLPVLLHLQKQ